MVDNLLIERDLLETMEVLNTDDVNKAPSYLWLEFLGVYHKMQEISEIMISEKNDKEKLSLHSEFKDEVINLTYKTINIANVFDLDIESIFSSSYIEDLEETVYSLAGTIIDFENKEIHNVIEYKELVENVLGNFFVGLTLDLSDIFLDLNTMSKGHIAKRINEIDVEAEIQNFN